MAESDKTNAAPGALISGDAEAQAVAKHGEDYEVKEVNATPINDEEAEKENETQPETGEGRENNVGGPVSNDGRDKNAKSGRKAKEHTDGKNVPAQEEKVKVQDDKVLVKSERNLYFPEGFSVALGFSVLTKAQAEVATKHRAVSEATAEEAKDYYGVA